MHYRKLLHKLHQNIPESFIGFLFEGSTLENYHKETLIVRQDETMSDFYLVESGIIRSFFSNIHASVTTEFFFQGEMISSFTPSFTINVGMNNLQSITDVTVRSCPVELFKQRVMSAPEIRDFFDQMNAIYMMEQQYRSQLFRTSSAIERYELLMRDYPEYLNLIPLKYLASFIDMNRETMSRMRKKMKNGKNNRKKQFHHVEPA